VPLALISSVRIELGNDQRGGRAVGGGQRPYGCSAPGVPPGGLRCCGLVLLGLSSTHRDNITSVVPVC
jgi:hypothetical protein